MMEKLPIRRELGTPGVTLSSAENVYTSHQHRFGNGVRAQYRLVSGRNHRHSKQGTFAVVFGFRCEIDWGIDFTQRWQEFRGRWNIGHFAEGVIYALVIESRHLVSSTLKCICHGGPRRALIANWSTFSYKCRSKWKSWFFVATSNSSIRSAFVMLRSKSLIRIP